MASVGFAVGLGNIWRFPYVTGENGGAAFVLVYLVCAIIIGVPIVMAEILIGRRGRAGIPAAMRALPGASAGVASRSAIATAIQPGRSDIFAATTG